MPTAICTVEKNDTQACINRFKSLLLSAAEPSLTENEISRITGMVSKTFDSTGFIGLEVSDIDTLFDGATSLYVGIGLGSGTSRATDAVQEVLTQPQCGANVCYAGGALVLIDASEDVELSEIEEAVTLIQEKLPDNANVLFSADLNASMSDCIRISLILVNSK